jgi:WD40 repeat protein
MENINNKSEQFPKNNNFSNPNLKFKKIITKNNYCGKFKHIFEIFESLKDKEVYLASSNKYEYMIDIIKLKTNKPVISLKGHHYFVNIVKYFKNKNNNKEYLISCDKANVIIIWDIINQFSNIYKIECKISIGFISDALIFFDNKEIYGKIDDYIIFSFDCHYYTNIYSLNNKKKIGIIEHTNEYNTYYLLLWFHKKNKTIYLIELSNGNIYIYNINKNTLYFIFTIGSYENSKINSGFIYNKNNNDLLIVCFDSGIISIINLEAKKQYPNFYYKSFEKNKINLSYLLLWSNKYIIACECYNKGLIIIDIDTFKLISSIKGKYLGGIIYAKKFIHPIYGESLFTLDQDNTIILWSKK